jgi:hypothetical protein
MCSLTQTLRGNDLDHIGRLLLTHPWRFAKTMPENPHYYTLVHEWQRDTFVEVVRALQTGGYKDVYPPPPARGRVYRAVNVNGMKYWTMGYPPEKTTLINRKDIAIDASGIAIYDQAAEIYDSLYVSPEERQHELSVMKALWSAVGPLTGKSVLDIGCGTGLLLDYNTPGRYVGVDPSRKMLDRLIAKHPDRSSDVIQAKLEEFVLPPPFEPFDVVVSLYGSVSYADPDAVATIPRFANPDGGQWFVMAYGDGYDPLIHQFTGDPAFHYGLPPDLPGRAVPFPNYAIVTGQHGG